MGKKIPVFKVGAKFPTVTLPLPNGSSIDLKKGEKVCGDYFMRCVSPGILMAVSDRADPNDPDLRDPLGLLAMDEPLIVEESSKPEVPIEDKYRQEFKELDVDTLMSRYSRTHIATVAEMLVGIKDIDGTKREIIDVIRNFLQED